MSLTHDMRVKGSDQELGLIDLCETVRNKLGDNLQIIEVGSYCGGSSQIIATHFKTSQINCVDPWTSYVENCSVYDLNAQALELKEAEQKFDIVVQSNSNIVKNKLSSNDYVLTIADKSIDFIYIDGNHQYTSVTEDVLNWLPKIKSGGVIAGHDYCWSSVSQALHDVLKKEPEKTFRDSSWLYFV